MGPNEESDGKRGGGCPNFGPDILGCGPVGDDVCAGVVCDDPTPWEGFRRIPSLGGPKADRGATSEREGWCVGIPPAGGHNDVGGPAGGGDLRFFPLENSCIVYCDQAHYVPVSSGGVETGATGLQVVVGTGRGECGGDVDSGLGCGMAGGGGGDVQDSNRDRQLIMWEYNVANIILGAEPNAALSYAPVLEIHHPIMCMIGWHGGRLESYRERE